MLNSFPPDLALKLREGCPIKCLDDKGSKVLKNGLLFTVLRVQRNELGSVNIYVKEDPGIPYKCHRFGPAYS
jgi:hypothetical protein